MVSDKTDASTFSLCASALSEIRDLFDGANQWTTEWVRNHPAGRTVTFGAFRAALIVLMRRAYRLTSSNHGQMFLQVPREIMQAPEFSTWVNLLNQSGMPTIVGDRVIRIEKLPSSPLAIPTNI